MNETPQENNELVTIERRDDGVTIATLNRADRLNALSVAMTSAITDAFRMLHRDRSTKAVVLAGAGRAFCAGADLSGDSEPAPDSEDRGPVGSIFRGEEADRFGMLNRCVTDGDPVGPAIELAQSIVRNSEYGVWMTKRGMWLGLESSSLRTAIEMENRTQVLGTFSGNMGEGIRAFLEHRTPDWKPL